ncbi:MAG: decarboxylating 6-phosphogluconate dehydrogenase [Candidatus Paceibacterota bacterium]
MKDTKQNKKMIGIVGLGKMGAGIARQLHEKGWNVCGYNRSAPTRATLAQEGIETVATLEELVERIPVPRTIWLMVPAKKPTHEMLFGKVGLATLLAKGDSVIDGGNSFYKDSVVNGKKLAKYGIKFMDVGFSGGPSGARNGGCLMIGGDATLFNKYETLFKDLSRPGAYKFFKGVGAGHFVKMVHNGIEYGMMQALAEGFAVLKKSPYKLDLTRVAEIYNNGSVIESRLVGWMKGAFETYGADLKKVSGTVAHTGEGQWTVQIAKSLKVPAQVIGASFKFRVDSVKKQSYTGKLLSALRNQFGGHAVK